MKVSWTGYRARRFSGDVVYIPIEPPCLDKAIWISGQ